MKRVSELSKFCEELMVYLYNDMECPYSFRKIDLSEIFTEVFYFRISVETGHGLSPTPRNAFGSRGLYLTLALKSPV